jgi:hypothetical protein
MPGESYMNSQTREQFLWCVERSELVDRNQLAQAVAEIDAANPQAANDGDCLADALIERKLLTRWQVENLRLGKSAGFFLGQYKILGLLGSGHSGSVYLAQHLITSTPKRRKWPRHGVAQEALLRRHGVYRRRQLANDRREARAVGMVGCGWLHPTSGGGPRVFARNWNGPSRRQAFALDGRQKWCRPPVGYEYGSRDSRRKRIDSLHKW